jgi:predicted deacylase
VVAVPVANPLGLVSRQRGWPGEARGPLDMNRLFPGDARGPLSSRIAHRIFHDVLVRCDYCIDLHGGMTGSAEAPFAQVVMLDDRHRTLTTRRKMAEAFGTELIYEMRQKERGRHAVFRGLEFSFAEQARLAGVPTLVVELGEGGRLNGSLVELASRGIQNVMVILGMLDLPIVKAPTRYRFQSVAILRPDRGGILTMDVRPGERVEKGTLVGRISDCLRVVERLRAPAKGIVQRVVTSAVTEPGADVLWIAQAGRS